MPQPTLHEFLAARLKDDEAVWEPGGYPHSGHATDFWGAYNPRCPDCAGSTGAGARHKAEIAAKRRTIEYMRGLELEQERDSETAAQYRAVWWVATRLASVYAEHPDYRQDWAISKPLF